jgi:hypothetical protein
VKRSTISLSFILALAGAAACSSSKSVDATPPDQTASDGGDSTADGGVPFEPEPPAVYVAKVKNILVGLPPTDDEVKTVTADPTQLATLIDGWMKLPQYTTKMERFFELSFQQTQITIADLAEQTFPRPADVNASTSGQLAQNVKESFARTVLELMTEGKPFTDTMTTQSFMMTPALMELYAFLDAWQVNDDGKVVDRFRNANPALNLTIEAAQGPIPIADSINPASPNFMHWYDPDLSPPPASYPAQCQVDPVVIPATGVSLHFILTGAIDTHKDPSGTIACGQLGGSAAAPQLQATDYTTWKMVTIRPPKSGETPTAFYDLPTLRSATELVLTIPRVGFFSTPAFFANWQTNTSNQMRVTTNQALIVALGSQVDGNDTTIPTSTPGLDTTHAADPACAICHKTLDPTRSIMSATWSWNYHDQDTAALTAQHGLFVFQGVQKQVANASDFGATLASHPLFAPAWAQKLCYYANSAKCEPDDPELQRVVGVFTSSGYSWNALVKAMMSSPLITHATATKTATEDGETIAVSRRDHFCAAMNARLGFTDVCGLDVLSKAAAKGTIPEIVSGLPSDGYGRGAVAPVLPNQPTLFYRTGIENICETIATQVIDPQPAAPAGVKTWAGAQPDAAIADFVAIIMALPPSDPRASQAQTLLKAHFTAATQTGASATDSLRSTFTIACLSPSSVSIGL